jgi:hypothetical protein
MQDQPPYVEARDHIRVRAQVRGEHVGVVVLGWRGERVYLTWRSDVGQPRRVGAGGGCRAQGAAPMRRDPWSRGSDPRPPDAGLTPLTCGHPRRPSDPLERPSGRRQPHALRRGRPARRRCRPARQRGRHDHALGGHAQRRVRLGTERNPARRSGAIVARSARTCPHATRPGRASSCGTDVTGSAAWTWGRREVVQVAPALPVLGHHHVGGGGRRRGAAPCCCNGRSGRRCRRWSPPACSSASTEAGRRRPLRTGRSASAPSACGPGAGSDARSASPARQPVEMCGTLPRLV